LVNRTPKASDAMSRKSKAVAPPSVHLLNMSNDPTTTRTRTTTTTTKWI
jgi:hypothetical protein